MRWPQLGNGENCTELGHMGLAGLKNCPDVGNKKERGDKEKNKDTSQGDREHKRRIVLEGR